MDRLRATAIPRVWVAVAVIAAAANATVALGNVLVEAHRGASWIAPENTIASIGAAIGSADLTEFDVRETADGKLVLMHDSTVNRTTNGSGSVSSLTLAQIQTLDAGSWFAPTFAGEPVPTMSEAISFAMSVGIEPLVERKAGGAVTYHNEFVSTGLAPADFRVISFDWSFLDGMDTLNSSYNLGALGGGVLDQSAINTAQAQGADFLDWSHSSVTQATVDLVHANGMELHVWTVNDSFRMQQLIDYGVDGITTDNPATLSWLVLRSSPDLNGDSLINETDWQWYHAGRGVDLTGLSDLEAYQKGDMDGDLDNDIADFVRFKGLYLAAVGGSEAEFLYAIPEPVASVLMVSASLLFCWGRSRSFLPAEGQPPRSARPLREQVWQRYPQQC